jgi:hypothetical protein
LGPDVGAARKAKCALSNSFTPATLVLLADGTSKPIEDIEIGDLVLATDPETGVTTGKPSLPVSKAMGSSASSRSLPTGTLTAH